MNIYMKILLLLGMIFMHIIADYNQGWIAEAKQKKYWEKNVPDMMHLYKNDYKVVMLIHSFKWTFLMMLIPMSYMFISFGYKITNSCFMIIISLFILNIWIHYIVDDMKANKFKINLVFDQSMHLLQIIATWLFTIMI